MVINTAAGYPGISRWALFKRECDKFGILYQMPDIIAGYKNKYEKTQLNFLDEV